MNQNFSTPSKTIVIEKNCENDVANVKASLNRLKSTSPGSAKLGRRAPDDPFLYPKRATNPSTEVVP